MYFNHNTFYNRLYVKIHFFIKLFIFLMLYKLLIFKRETITINSIKMYNSVCFD